ALLEVGTSPNANDTYGYGYKPLMHASENGHLACVQALLFAGADVDTALGGYSALGRAAKGGYTDVVQCLLEAGADANGPLMHGFTSAGMPVLVRHYDSPLMHASGNGHLACVRTLPSAGATVFPGMSTLRCYLPCSAGTLTSCAASSKLARAKTPLASS
ncbi:ankyrin repeat-containing domain protein, partial [Pavlovales sp. CCMP2436]